MPTTILVKTWACSNYPNCIFTWQFEGESVNSSPHDLTIDQLNIQFPEFPMLKAGECPACHSKGIVGSELSLVIEPERMSKITVATDAELADELAVEETDSQGNVVLAETDEIREQVVIKGGKLEVVEEKVFSPVKRQRTKAERDEIKEQRDQELDILNKIAVKEVSEAGPEA